MREPIVIRCSANQVKLTCAAQFQAEVKAADGQPAPLPAFSMLAYTGAAMYFSQFESPLVIDLKGLDISNQQVPIGLEHSPRDGVGHSTAITKTGGEVRATGVVSRATSAAQEVLASSRNGYPWQASITAEVSAIERVAAAQTVRVNGQQFQGPINIARKAVLTEISFVQRGADSATTAKVAASQTAHSNEGSTMKFTAWLLEAGFIKAGQTEADLPDAQVTVLRAAFEAKQAKPDAPAATPATATTLEATRAAEAAEVERVAAIRTVAKDHPAIAARAIREGWTADKTELEATRASRPTAPLPRTGENAETDCTVIEAAMGQAIRMRNLEKHYQPKVLEAAHKMYRGRLSIKRVLVEAAQRNGCQERFLDAGNMRVILQAAFSSNDVAGILSNLLNKVLLETQAEGNTEWRQFAKISTVNDLKTKTSYRLTSGVEYEEVGPGGEIKLGTLGEESYEIKARTYAKGLGISRADIINDDLGAFEQVREHLGLGANQKLNSLFYTTFLDDAAFFASGNANLVTGAGSALGHGAIKTAITKLRKQTSGGTGAKQLNLQPLFMLVPPELEWLAKELVQSAEIRDTTASTVRGASNTLPRMTVIVSPFLSNTGITGYSTTAWYVLADPRMAPVMEVAFLNGQEAPAIESAEADFFELGIRWRGVHDFGVAKLDYRGGVKNNGA